jgi:hypothetical protein
MGIPAQLKQCQWSVSVPVALLVWEIPCRSLSLWIDSPEFFEGLVDRFR